MKMVAWTGAITLSREFSNLVGLSRRPRQLGVYTSKTTSITLPLWLPVLLWLILWPLWIRRLTRKETAHFAELQ